MFLALNKLKGTTVFYSDDVKILKIKSNAIDSNTSEAVMNNIDSIPYGSHWDLSNRKCPRYQEFIVASTDGRSVLFEDTIEKIEEEVLSLGPSTDVLFYSDLQKVSHILKCHKQRENKQVRIDGLFYSASLPAMNPGNLSIPGVGTMSGKISQTSFEFDLISNDNDANYLVFCNEFENITIPIVEKCEGQRNIPNVSTLELISRIKGRSCMSGRVSSDYTVHKMHNSSLRPSLSTKQIPVMRIEEMLRMFGTTKKCQTKVETLSECLRSWTQRYCVPSEACTGKNFFIEIGDDTTTETLYDLIPVDWLLVHASLMKVTGSEVTDKSSTRLMVQMTDKPVDDIAQMLYASLEAAETNKRKSISILGLREDIMDKAIVSLKNTLVKNTDVVKEEDV